MNTYSVLEERTDLIAIQPLGAAPRTERAAMRIEPAGSAASNLVRFWELRGRRVVHEDGVAWGEYKGPFFTSLPFQVQLDMERPEIDRLMRKHSLRGIRYPSANQPGIESGLYVCSPAGYGMQSVNRKLRVHITAGLEACEIRDIDPQELERVGMELNRDTLARQKRADQTFLDEGKFRAFVRAVGACPGMRIHGAYAGRRLASYLISCRDGEWLHLMYKMSRADCLESHPNHALDFAIVRDAEPGVKWIANGFTAVGGHDGLDRYKRYMGYEVKKHNVCIHLHPAIAPLAVNRAAVAVVKQAARMAKNERLAYAATILEGAIESRKRPEEMPAADEMCQQEEAGTFSRLRRPATLFPALRAMQTFKTGGVSYVVKRGADFLKRKMRKKTAKPAVAGPRPFGPEEVLNLQPGDWVEVKPLDEIYATLDAKRKNRGLLFTDDMRGFAGKKLRVFKRVESIFLEESKQRRTVKNTVLLEDSYCPGITFRCDRSCFLFWKETWLKRVDSPQG